jgi:hypothetical protein
MPTTMTPATMTRQDIEDLCSRCDGHLDTVSDLPNAHADLVLLLGVARLALAAGFAAPGDIPAAAD